MTGFSDRGECRAHRCLLLVALLCMAQSASAFPGGITVRSGKQGTICNACHSGGTAPIVEFQGPVQVPTGQAATFRFLVRSQAPQEQTFAGFNVAASAGTLDITSDQGGRAVGGELTHNLPKANDGNGEAAWEFTWNAPDTPGDYTLFGAGNSVNGKDGNRGDRAAATTAIVMVGSQVTPPTATPTPTGTPSQPTPTRSPTPLGGRCVGDCNGDLKVNINELILGVNISLQQAPLGQCSAFDANNNKTVAINELIAAVNNALGGCP